MEFTAGQIAQMLGGEVVGNENAVINTLCKIEEGIEKGINIKVVSEDDFNNMYTEVEELD